MPTLQPTVVGKKPSSVIARFYKNGNKTMVAVQYAGDAGQEAVAKVTPDLIKQFPEAYDAFINGLELPEPEGIPLTEIPGFTLDIARVYKMQNVMVCEQLAAASDAVCQRLGMGAINFRKMAKIMVKAKQQEKMVEQMTNEAAAKAATKVKKTSD